MNCRIEIRGLSYGEHPFSFKVDGSFFEAYENDTVSDADLDVSAVVTKEHGRMALDLSITGNVTVKCDRCLADLTVPVDIQVPFSVMFSSYAADADADGDGADEVILLDSDGQCDPVMMEKLKDILKTE